MSKKPKFNPEITKVKLNPEQAVLSCSCYSQGWRSGTGTGGYQTWCHPVRWMDYAYHAGTTEDGRS